VFNAGAAGIGFEAKRIAHMRRGLTAGFILLAFVAAATMPDVVCAGTINIPKASVHRVTTPKVNNGGKAAGSGNTNYSDPENLGQRGVATSGQANTAQSYSKAEYDNLKQFQKTAPQATQQIWQSQGSGYQKIKP
jgi:hypothetical protein